ncbi:MAG: isoleucine--tRNA ligase [Gammaproteobacteria bacterium]|jgi:isoleucyl-tRNA synthetase|nr:isoleucine--tRNA ligase [Gammaproteobacteria bacterium]MBT4491617.1 isoleucine--tRNA ligase [Gammaproteobacteria bacterium]MBT7371911.1 isoleucine--tRNA ligase [Gammaproteobacteria bacterium]
MADKTDPNDETFSFVAAEHKILDFWDKEDVFRRSMQQTENAEPYIFYDGPPFATGLPHHGHLVASTIKDVVPRYFTMKGRYVQRRFGWDCHGLPVEHEIDKALGMSSIEAVEKLGIKGYNDECRGIVQRYTTEWRKTINRIGRWVDFDHDYKTMEPWYMESVWWVVRQLWDKGLIYRGEKVVPFSTELGTVLSNFEAGSNYQDVQDPAITVLFKLRNDERYIAAWTTTPWTLPSNLALCVGADIDYIEAKDATGKVIIVARERLEAMSKGGELEALREFKGTELVGLKYEPLLPYFSDLESEGAFVVLSDDYVSTESGTGVVHQAPAFGEDDFRILKAAGIQARVCPVDMSGQFTAEVTDFAGMHVKEADKQIIRLLKDQGSLYIQDVIVHSYPFCPRSDTPIIYRTIDSWYVRVEQMRDQLKAANEQINWVPGHIKNGRMGNWLEGAIDWAISRNRYWGTPLPIWINDETGSMRCIGSREELNELTGVMLDDLHRENVDPLTFTVEGEAGTYRRITEVLDCWFESGSMPYAQLHYPFENQSLFERGFPAEFIAEGLDQTRGWFYTLIVLGTALFGTHPFKNVIVNGIVMAEDGKKMSKRLRNYTPPDDLMESYGADALRLYLINSGLVKAEEQRFTDTGVKDMVRRALLPWLNAFKFLHTYTQIDNWKPDDVPKESDNIMDQWILSRLESLKFNIATEMENYRLYNVVPALFDFIEDLTNWYIRLNRTRFWVEEATPDKLAAYQTLYTTIFELSVSMAPFAPFLAETVYQSLREISDQDLPLSVHLCEYPEASGARIKPLLEQAVTRMQHIILLGRQKRNQEKVKTKYPVANLTIIHRDMELLDEIARLEDYLSAELNVKNLSYSTDEQSFIHLYAKPNSPILGKRLGKRFKDFKQRIETLDSKEIEELQNSGELTLDGERFEVDDVLIFREAMSGTNALSDRFISIDMDCTLNDELIKEGLAREVVNRVQKSRKDAGYNVSDRIRLTVYADGRLADAINTHEDYIRRETLALELSLSPESQELPFSIDDEELSLTLSLASD